MNCRIGSSTSGSCLTDTPLGADAVPGYGSIVSAMRSVSTRPSPDSMRYSVPPR